jgi:hypothetical protein
MPLTLLLPVLVRKHFLVSQNGLKSVNNAATLSKVPFFSGKSIWTSLEGFLPAMGNAFSWGPPPLSRSLLNFHWHQNCLNGERDDGRTKCVTKATTTHLSNLFPRSGDIAVVLEQKPAASLVGVRSHRLNLCELFRRMLRKLAGVRSSGAR